MKKVTNNANCFRLFSQSIQDLLAKLDNR